jgi:methanogenic corrinoid protein MtbC1
MSMLQDLINAFIDMREQDALRLTHQLLAAHTPPLEIIDACRKAMAVVGQRFQDGECFIPELILSGEMLTTITEILKPHMTAEAAAVKLGKVVIGTVEGDIHDIAKNIVALMLDINGFEVIDLGVDVSPAKFVEAVRQTGAKIVGLSGFLTLAFDPMKETVAALKTAGLEAKVMIGGGQVDEQVRRYTGAHAYGKDAVEAVALAKNWVKG